MLAMCAQSFFFENSTAKTIKKYYVLWSRKNDHLSTQIGMQGGTHLNLMTACCLQIRGLLAFIIHLILRRAHSRLKKRVHKVIKSTHANFESILSTRGSKECLLDHEM